MIIVLFIRLFFLNSGILCPIQIVGSCTLMGSEMCVLSFIPTKQVPSSGFESFAAEH